MKFKRFELYSLIRPLLFKLDPEVSHDFTIKMLKVFQHIPGILSKPNNQQTSIQCMGLTFPNRVGLAAGLDKNGECVKAWQSLGFGFVEVGTVTPRPQSGNPKPRLFRLPKEKAILNRFGFNNRGIDYLLDQLRGIKRFCPIGINIGKNRDTPLEQASEDYRVCFEKAYALADYVTVNISSPNTPGLRSLQQSDSMRSIIKPIIEDRKRLADRYSKQVPIVVKVSPDLTPEEIAFLVDDLIDLAVDGVIATNTTIAREGGGLSGAPLKAQSTKVVRLIYERAKEALPIIAVGGILTPDDAKEKFEAGAKLIQLYTGFIYEGPRLISDINQSFLQQIPS